MEWTSPRDELLAGECAAGLRDAAELAWMVGTWREGTARAFEVAPGRVAWLRVTKAGGLLCVAVAPDDGRREVPEPEFFAAPFPASWTTKSRAGMTAKPAHDWSRFTEGGFAFGVMQDRAAVLAKVRDVMDGAPREVQPSPDAPWMRREDHGARRWFGLTKWPRGAATLWDAGRVAFRDYRMMCNALWRADDPAAVAASRAKAAATMKAAREARKAATR